ncbi:MAG: class I SAM-dependent methyltransferase [Anaerolineae bacterium]
MTYWDKNATKYARLGRSDFWFKHRLRLIEGLSGSTLEACCGGGDLVLAMLDEGLDAYGFDLSGAMVELAAAALAGSGHDPRRISRADVTCIPHPDGAFDVVLCTGALGLFDQTMQRRALDELTRVAYHEVRLLEPYEKRPGLYPARVLGAMFAGQKPIRPAQFEGLGVRFSVEWDAVAGVFSYIRLVK